MRSRKGCNRAQFVREGSQMAEALQKLKLTNKHSEMLLEHPQHLDLVRLEFASAALCMYMHVLYIIMNMIMIRDNT